MNALLALTLLSGWSYDGFAVEPGGSSPVSAGSERTGDREDRQIRGRGVEPPATNARETETVEATTISRDVAPWPVFHPDSLIWRLSDAGGQIWEHENPAWLAQWVSSKNDEITSDRAGERPSSRKGRGGSSKSPRKPGVRQP